MNIGLAQGLAQSGQYDQKINDSRYQQQMLRNQEALNESKRKLFESDIEYQQGGNAFDQPIVKAETEKIITALGNFVADNPDWETNFQKRAYVRQLKNNVKDNPHVLRAKTTNDQRTALLKYAQEAKQKGVPFNEDALNAELIRYQNYEKFGNADGQEAAEKEGMKAYLFTRPQDFIDTDKLFSELGNKFKDMRVNTKVKGGLGAYEEYADPDSLKAVATQVYQNNKNQFDIYARKTGEDPIQHIMTGLDSYIPKKRDMGDYGLQKSMALERYKYNLENQNTAPVANTYQMAIRSQDSSMVPVKAIDAIVGEGAKTIIKSKDGKITDVTGLFNTKNTGYNLRADNKGTRLAESIGYIPLEQAIEMGIVDSGFGPFSDDEVKPNYKQYAQIVTNADKDGNAQKAVKITAFKVFDENNQANEGIFNSETMTSKQQPLPSDMYKAKTIKIGGHDIPVGSKVTDNTTGKVGYLQSDGTVK